MKRSFAILPGDGIGVDVTREAVKVLEAVASADGFELRLENFPYGADHYLSTGETLPDDALERFRTFDAVFMGALGDPRVPEPSPARNLGLRGSVGSNAVRAFCTPWTGVECPYFSLLRPRTLAENVLFHMQK